MVLSLVLSVAAASAAATAFSFTSLAAHDPPLMSDFHVDSHVSRNGHCINCGLVTPTKAVGRLPALGWNTWNAYGCDITADVVNAAAYDLLRLGLVKAGYQYVNIDDCWAEQSRDGTTKRIVPDPKKFPNGISDVASHVHSMGLKLGIYSDAGTTTCNGYPGSLGYEEIDAATFTEWGVDYLKYDNCNVPANWMDSPTPPNGDWYNSNSSVRYRQMTVALNNQTTPVEYNICIWGQANVWEWGSRVGHSWRVTTNIAPTWDSIISTITANAALLDYVDFYAHNDMDMMEIGNGDLTIQEQRSHFAVWAFMKSPIILGTNLSALSTEQLSIVTNPALLAFHQDDKHGWPAKPFQATSNAPTTSPPEYYAGKSKNGTHVFVLNTANSNNNKTFDVEMVPGIGKPPYTITDMWTGETVIHCIAPGMPFSVSVDAHDTKAYLIAHTDSCINTVIHASSPMQL